MILCLFITRIESKNNKYNGGLKLGESYEELVIMRTCYKNNKNNQGLKMTIQLKFIMSQGPNIKISRTMRG